MRIGLTYDLKRDYLDLGWDAEELAELDEPSTVEAIAGALRRLGHLPEPVGNLFQLVPRLAAGHRWDLVFNIAEGVRGLGREATVPALLDAYGIPYTFSDPVALGLCLHKALAKRVVRDRGVPTPDFALVTAPAEVAAVSLSFPLFAKPVGEGSSKGISAASVTCTRKELRRLCEELIARFHQPVLVERFLPGRELTVGVLGTGRAARVLGVMEVVFGPQAEPGGYTYRNKVIWQGIIEQRLVEHPLAAEAGQVALAGWRALGCRDAGRVDLKLDDDGRPQFLEVNPLAGLAPGASDLTLLCGLLGFPYDELLRQIVESAMERVEAAPARSVRTVGVP